MALQKSLEQESGVSGDYVKIKALRFYYNGADPYVIADVDLYKDSDARQASKSPLKESHYNILLSALPNLDNYMETTRTSVYNYLKTLPEYEGSSDV